MNYFLGIDSTTGTLVGDFEDSATGLNHPVAGTTAIPTDNSWHHAAASYDGTTWRLYLDGKLETKDLEGAFTPRSDSIQHAALGTAMSSTGVAAGFFQGALDETRVWNVARTSTQIRAAKDTEITGPQAGLRARWSLDEGSGTNVGDTSGNNVTGSAVNGPSWVSPYGFPQDSNAPADPTGLSAASDDGAVAVSWTANGETDVAGYDLYRSTSPGVSTAGTPVNGADLIRGTGYQDTGLANGTQYYYVLVAVDGSNNRSGASNEDSATPLPAGSKGLQFNGSNQHVTFGAAPGLATPTFTLETWFMRTGAGVGQQTGTEGLTSAVPLISKGRNQDEGSNVDMNYFLGIDTATNALAVDFEEGAGGSGPLGQNHPLIGSTPVTSNVWHHAAATYDGTTWKIYLDGKLDKSLAVGEPARGDSIQHAALGTAMNSTGVAAGFFQGVLDEARIWDHARTGAEVRSSRNLETPGSTAGLLGQWHLDEANGTNVADSTGHGNTGTTVNGPGHVSGYGFQQDSAPPTAVQGLTATQGDGSATLAWDAGSEPDLAGYDVFRGMSSPVSTGGTPLNGDDLLTSPGFTDTGLTNAQTYYYAIVAVDSSNNASPSTETNVTPAPADPVFVGAGDIAGTWAGDEATAQLLDGIPGTVFTIGDNAYDNGLASEFATYYEPTWGRHKSRTRPTAGNHDYGNGSNDGSGYFDYFNGAGNETGPAGDRDLGYYSYDLSGNGSTWHIVVLNSECEPSGGDWLAGGCAAGSTQEQWLRTDLANASTNNIIALFHKPRYSSSTPQSHLQALWQALYDHGVELVLGGHWHNYERLGPMNAAGAADPTYGVRQFVVGTGGASFAGFGTTWPTSEVRNNNTTGVIKFTLHATSYDWQFIPTAGSPGFTDSGTGTVHGPPPDTDPPTVTIVSAVPASLGPSDSSTDLTWRADENGAYSVRVGGTGCTNGTIVASGSYSSAPANVTTTIDAAALADGANTIRVCVTDAGTNTGAATSSVSKSSTPAANALHFDGAGDYVSFGQATGSLGATQFTLETWVRRTGAGAPTSTGSGGVTDAIPLVTKGHAENDTPANVNMNYFLGIDASSGVLVADFEDDNGGENHPVSGATQINADSTWHHVAASYDGSTWRLYLDGRLDAKSPTGGETPEDTSLQHAGLGTAFDSTGVADGFFAGDLDEVRIWNVARSGAQIRANRNTEITGSQAGLRGRWGLDEGAGGSAADSSGNGVGGTLTGAVWIPGYGFPQDSTAPGAPAGLDVAAGDTQVALSWNANPESDVAGYNVFRSQAPGVSTAGTPVNGSDLVTGTAFTDVGLSNGTPYYYVVVAVDGSNNASTASNEDSAAPVQGDPVLVGAGDIADCARTGDTATANLVSSIPGTVWTAGDNVYQNGLLTEFNNCYEPTWGAFKARTRPTPGNHDYGNGSNDGSGYFDYFNGVGNATGPAGDRDKGYYSYDVGNNWHVVVLNSECYYYPVCGSATLSTGTAAQLAWLRDDLSANASRNVVAMFHKPRWSSGASQPGLSILQPLWQTLYEYGAELVLTGHDHHYERFAPQNAAGQADASSGMRQFIVGTGGASHTSLNAAAANSEFRNGTTDGVLKLTLHASSYDWQYLPTTGGILDSGTTAVHAAPNLRPVIDSVAIDQASPKTTDVLSATVTAHDPNGDPITIAYQWRRNGADIAGQTGATLNLATSGNGDKGDQIAVRVTGSDTGGSGGPLTSASVTVLNTSPTATVALNTHAPGTNATLTATATKADVDGDAVALTFVWKTNGVVRRTTTTSSSLTDSFDLSQPGNGDAGDTVTVEVTPNDGAANGPLASDSAAIDTAPAAPTDVQVVVSTSAVTLDWANNTETDLAGYNVYRSTAVGGPYTKLNAAALTTSSYTDSAAPAQATSYYRVSAVDTGGAESPFAETQATREIALRGSSSGQAANASSLSLAKPGGVVAGDLLLAVVDVAAAATITPPSGWTLVRVDTNGTVLRQGTYRRIATASEPTSYAFAFSGKQSGSGALLAYSGVSTSQPVDASSGKPNNSGSSLTAESITTSVPDAAIVGLFGTAVSTSVTPPGGMIERAEVSSGGKQKTTTEVADALQPSASSTGAKTATATGSAANIGQLVALRPSTAAPPQDNEPPTQPSGVVASAVSSSQIDVTWTASTDNIGVDHYVVTRGSSSFTTTQTQFSDTGLAPNTQYTYTVTAYDASNNASTVSDPASATTSSGGGGGGTGITFRGVATAQDRSAASLTLSKPSGTQAGDVLVASLDVRAAAASITAPSGWTLLQQTESGGVLTKATFWHLASASESSYTWSFGSTQAVTGILLAYGGVDAADPIVDSTSAATTTTSLAAPSANAGAGSLVVALMGLSTNGGITPPSAMSERGETTAGSGQSRVTGEASDAVQASAGATGPRTATAGKAAPGVAQLVVLRRAP